MEKILQSCQEVLASEPKVELGTIPIRFAGLGAYSLDVEIFAYIATADFDEYLGIQTRLLLKLVAAVEATGTGLAVPWQQTPGLPTTSPSPGVNYCPDCSSVAMVCGSDGGSLVSTTFFGSKLLP